VPARQLSSERAGAILTSLRMTALAPRRHFVAGFWLFTPYQLNVFALT
jgi:hypothetical protein